MHIVKSYPDGVFSWVDLTTTDVAGAKAFYGGLFGWEGEDIESEGSLIYTMMKLDGYNAAGIGPMQPAMAEQGMPPHWSSYVNHSDVDAIAAKAVEAGGQVMFAPMDVLDSGRMTTIQDPTGAMFGVWQARNHIGAQVVNQANALVWNELQTRDSEAAKAFYGAVFGWAAKADENGYVTYAVNDRIQAGMLQMDENWPETVPANWVTYFMVEDVQAAANKAQELGGTLMMPPTPAGEMGTFALIQDPQGGVFTVMQFNGPVDTPPG